MAREATKATKTATPDQLLAPPNSPRAPASSKKSAWCRPEVEANRRISLLAILKTPATFSVVFKPAPLRSGRWDRGSLVRRLEIQHSTMRIHNTFYHTSTKIICLPPPIKKPKYERLHWLYRYLNDSPILSHFPFPTVQTPQLERKSESNSARKFPRHFRFLPSDEIVVEIPRNVFHRRKRIHVNVAFDLQSGSLDSLPTRTGDGGAADQIRPDGL